MSRFLAITWALAMVACGPIAIVLCAHFVSQGEAARGVFDLVVGLATCAIGVGNLREAA